MAESCGGYCCEKFFFADNASPESLQETLRRNPSEENKLIVEMSVYVGEEDFDSHGNKGRLVHWYTCKHFDPATRLCRIYETRPKMCRDYGTKPWQPCNLEKCKLPKPEPLGNGELAKLDEVLPKLKEVKKERPTE